jgi:hypothetical protein
MIIYQVQPNRSYPIITNAFGKKYCNIYTFKHIFKFKSKEDEALAFNKDMIYYLPENSIVRSKNDNNFLKKFYREAFPENNSKQNIDFIHGVFPCNKYEKNKKDFIFTILDHPLTQVYNWFYYLKNINKICSNLETNKVYLESYEGYKYGPQETMIGQIFKNFPTLEEYVDNFIFNNGNISCFYNNLNFSFIDEIFHASYFDTLDFCGLMNNHENLNKSAEKISKYLFIEKLDLSKYNPISSITKESDYRIKELEVLLEKDIEFFKKKEEQLND